MGKSQLKTGIYLSYISLFVTNISNLILTPFIIRGLGDSEYGLYMLIGAFVGYIAVLDFGLGNATVRFVAKYRAENNKVKEENFLFSTFIIYAIISGIILFVGSIIYLNLSFIFDASLTDQEIKIAKTMFIILLINLAFTLPMKSFIGIINAYEKFAIPKLITIFRVLIRMGLVLLLLSLGYKAIAIVMIDAILNLAMLLLAMAYVFMKLKVKVKLHYFESKIFKEILSYSSWIFVSVIVDQIYWRIGHLILGIYVSTTEVAVFAIGIMFGQYFITFSTAISGVFLPKITRMVTNHASGEQLTNVLIRTGRIQFIILGLILTGFILIGQDFLILWAGSGYDESWRIGLIVMMPLTIVLTQTIGISILQAKNLHKFRAIIYLIIAIINTFISIYLSKLYGSVGAAIGTSLSLVMGNIIAINLYYHYKVNLNMLRFYKELFQGLLLAMGISLLLGSTINMITISSWVELIISAIIIVLMYIIVLWNFGMNKSEKNLFSNEIKKLLKKMRVINKV